LTEQEILMLLQRLADVHATHYGYEKAITNPQFNDFVQEIVITLRLVHC